MKQIPGGNKMKIFFVLVALALLCEGCTTSRDQYQDGSVYAVTTWQRVDYNDVYDAQGKFVRRDIIRTVPSGPPPHNQR